MSKIPKLPGLVFEPFVEEKQALPAAFVGIVTVEDKVLPHLQIPDFKVNGGDRLGDRHRWPNLPPLPDP